MVAVDASAFHAIGPIDIGMHRGQDRIDIAIVKRGIYRLDDLVVHDFPPLPGVGNSSR